MSAGAMCSTRPTVSRTEKVPLGARVVPSTCACDTVPVRAGAGEPAAAGGFAGVGPVDEEEAALAGRGEVPAAAEPFSARRRLRSATIIPLYEVLIFALLAIDCSSSRDYRPTK